MSDNKLNLKELQHVQVKGVTITNYEPKVDTKKKNRINLIIKVSLGNHPEYVNELVKISGEGLTLILYNPQLPLFGKSVIS